MWHLLFICRGLSVSRISLSCLWEDVRERRGRESQYQPQHQHENNHWIQSTGLAPAACQPVPQQVSRCKPPSLLVRTVFGGWGKHGQAREQTWNTNGLGTQHDFRVLVYPNAYRMKYQKVRCFQTGGRTLFKCVWWPGAFLWQNVAYLPCPGGLWGRNFNLEKVTLWCKILLIKHWEVKYQKTIL
jgi:hypothetical protein